MINDQERVLTSATHMRNSNFQSGPFHRWSLHAHWSYGSLEDRTDHGVGNVEIRFHTGISLGWSCVRFPCLDTTQSPPSDRSGAPHDGHRWSDVQSRLVNGAKSHSSPSILLLYRVSIPFLSLFGASLNSSHLLPLALSRKTLRDYRPPKFS